MLGQPARVKDLSTAFLARQTKRHRPIVPKYKSVAERPVADELGELDKVLSPHPKGVSVREVSAFEGQQAPRATEVQRVGTWYDPAEFLQKATRARHPMDTTCALDPVAVEVLDRVMSMDPRLLTVERKKAILSAKVMGLKLAPAEQRLHDGMPACVSKVVRGKKILLWEHLLRKHSYDDLGVVDFMKHGVPLVGSHNTPECFPLKLVPARVSERELWRRKALLAKDQRAVKPDHCKHPEDTARRSVRVTSLRDLFCPRLQ